MAKKNTRISFRSDPTIENLKSKIQNRKGWSRRDFLKTTGLAGTSALLGIPSEQNAAERPPETTALRLGQSPAICIAPLYLAAEFLRGEGFSKVDYIKTGQHLMAKNVASGVLDFAMNFAAPLLIPLDAGEPLVILAGGHTGCFELFGTNRISTIRDLKGKTVAIPELGSPYHIFVASMAAYVGLDPRTDINWVIHPPAEGMRLLAEEKIDAFLGFPPQPQELRAKKVGHVVVNSMMDKPWSQYFCCVAYTNRQFVQKHPVATKRALRAILKATDLCVREPQTAARLLVDRGFTPSYDYAFQTMKEMQMAYSYWREYDPEDTLRFYGLRLHEAGMIKSSPQKIIAQGTDWRFIRELKKELKG
jgi:NitT/TauT family transport system substrate-binding protein